MRNKVNPSLNILVTVGIYILILINNDYQHYLYLSILVLAICLISRVKSKLIKSIPLILYFWSFFLIINLILFNDPPYVLEIGIFKISFLGIATSLNSLWRITLLSWSSIALIGTLEDEELIYGFDHLLLPLRKIRINTRMISTIFMLTISSIPLLFTEIANIRKAQEARGIDIYSQNIFKRIKYMSMIIIPLLYGLFVRAEELIITLGIRRYDPSGPVTMMYINKYKKKEYLLLIGFGLIILGYFYL